VFADIQGALILMLVEQYCTGLCQQGRGCRVARVSQHKAQRACRGLFHDSGLVCSRALLQQFLAGTLCTQCRIGGMRMITTCPGRPLILINGLPEPATLIQQFGQLEIHGRPRFTLPEGCQVFPIPVFCCVVISHSMCLQCLFMSRLRQRLQAGLQDLQDIRKVLWRVQRPEFTVHPIVLYKPCFRFQYTLRKAGLLV
jgi:hypothetical protein